jgi:hypothetical protein
VTLATTPDAEALGHIEALWKAAQKVREIRVLPVFLSSFLVAASRSLSGLQGQDEPGEQRVPAALPACDPAGLDEPPNGFLC